MASEIRVNTINNSSGLGTITISDTGAVFTGVTTITSLEVSGSLVNVSGVTTVSAGSTSAPSITPVGDPDTGIFFPSANTIAFGEGGAEAARFDSSGRFGLGTTSPDQALSVQGLISTKDSGGTTRGLIGSPTWDASKVAIQNGTLADSATNVALHQNTLGTTVVNAASGQSVQFSINSGEKARIDSSGRLLVGTSAAITHYGGSTHKVQIAGSDFMQGGVSCAVFGNTNSGSYINLGLSRNTTIGSHTIVSNSDGLGGLTFNGSDGSGFLAGAQIEAYVDGTPGSNDMPGRLVFSTTADGANSPTERMRIDSQGRMGLGTASPTIDSGNGIHIHNSTESAIHFTNSTSGTTSTDGAYIGYNSNALLLKNTELGATIRFQTYDSERARIDGSGRLLVGTSTARSDFFNGAAPAQFQTEIAASSGLVNACFVNNGGGAGVIIGRSNGTSVGSNTIVSNGDSVGYLDFQAADGNNFEMVARIEAFVDGTPGNNDMPGRLVFSTTADGATNSTERMRIQSDARILFNTQSTAFNSGDFGHVFFPWGEAYHICDNNAAISINRNSDGNLIQFYTGNTSPVNQGNISVSGSTVTYGSFLGSHWGRLLDQSKPNIPVGTVLEVVDKLIDWKVTVFTVDEEEKIAAYTGSANVGDIVTIEYEGSFYDALIKEEDPQKDLNKHVYVKVSDTPGSKAVFGVFLGWDDDIPPGMVDTWNDLNIGALGNYFVRMASGQAPEIGDLVESDGTGCAVVQDDDIIRAKTVAKITSTIPQVTYDDGSFLVTCVLYCG